MKTARDYAESVIREVSSLDNPDDRKWLIDLFELAMERARGEMRETASVAIRALPITGGGS